MNSSEYVNRTDIGDYSKNISDRSDRYDDDRDIEAFINFIQCRRNNNGENNLGEEYVSKPFGSYDVDLGIKINGEVGITFDLEMMVPWDDDWPPYYSHVSFLDRKMKFLRRPLPFIMVWTNRKRNKFICVDKQTILKYKTGNHNVMGKFDKKRCISFDDSRLYGYNTNLTEREKRIFINHSVFKS